MKITNFMRSRVNELSHTLDSRLPGPLRDCLASLFKKRATYHSTNSPDLRSSATDKVSNISDIENDETGPLPPLKSMSLADKQQSK
jgi:hypothetical protein